MRRVDLQEGGVTIISVQSEAETSFISQLQFCGDVDEQADGNERRKERICCRREREREGRENEETPVGEG